jgi:hypothetical protein
VRAFDLATVDCSNGQTLRGVSARDGETARDEEERVKEVEETLVLVDVVLDVVVVEDEEEEEKEVMLEVEVEVQVEVEVEAQRMAAG